MIFPGSGTHSHICGGERLNEFKAQVFWNIFLQITLNLIQYCSLKENSGLTTHIAGALDHESVERLRDYITTNIKKCNDIKLSKTSFYQ